MDFLSKLLFYSPKFFKIGVDYSVNGEFFDENSKKIQDAEDNIGDWPKKPGFGYLTHEQVGFFVGATNGSRINLKKIGENSYHIQCVNEKYGIFMSVIVNFKKNELFIHNFTIKKENCGLGIGSRVIFRQCLMSKKLGIKKIYGYAAGSIDDLYYNGYYALSKMGYNGYLPFELAIKAKNDLKMNNFPFTVHDILDAHGGFTWWKDNGRGFDSWFCLSDESGCLERLLNYAKIKHIII